MPIEIKGLNDRKKRDQAASVERGDSCNANVGLGIALGKAGHGKHYGVQPQGPGGNP